MRVRMKQKDKDQVKALFRIYYRAKAEGNRRLMMGVLGHIMYVTNESNKNRRYIKTKKRSRLY